MNRGGTDDPENKYIQWRDQYLTQVDAEFEHFKLADGEARKASSADMEGLGRITNLLLQSDLSQGLDNLDRNRCRFTGHPRRRTKSK